MSDCEMPAVYDCEKRKARKDHVCYECGGVIKAGEKCVKTGSKRYCSECVRKSKGGK